MVVYAAATAAVAALIQPVIDHVLPEGTGLRWWCTSLLIVYAVKGLGGYASAFVMTDKGTCAGDRLSSGRCQALSSSIGLRNTPIPSISISQVSPAFIQTGSGLRA